MKHFVFCDNAGEVFSTISCQVGVVPPPPPGMRAVEVDRQVMASDVYVKGDVVKFKPPMPSTNHKFDVAKEKWLLDEAAAWQAVRRTRDQAIAKTDWVVLPDVSMSTEKKQAWLDYRQALRDVTLQPDPVNISWPKAPS